MYTTTILYFFYNFTNFLLKGFLLTPLFFLIIFFIVTTFFLYFSLKNIFKIFFLTETLLLIVVIFLAQLAVLYPNTLGLNFFYCQLILAAAAAEGALFLGLFSYLYEQQFSNWVISKITYVEKEIN